MLDTNELLPGARWVHQIEAGLQACCAFALIATREAMVSKFVTTEYAVAVGLAHKPDYHLQLTALVFDDVALPPILRTFRYVDFRGPDGSANRGVDELCRGLLQPIHARAAYRARRSWPQLEGR